MCLCKSCVNKTVLSLVRVQLVFLKASSIEELAQWADCECSRHSRRHFLNNLAVRAFPGTLFLKCIGEERLHRPSQTDYFGSDVRARLRCSYF